MNRNIRVAIDLDGVLTEHPGPLAEAANDRFNLTLPPSAFVDSAGHSVSLEARAWVYSDDGPAARLKASPQARQFLTRIVAEFGDENVFIVTARPDSSASMTEDWLRQNGLDVCPVVYADDKVEVALRLGITHAIEDSQRHAAAYQASGVMAFFLTDGNAPVPEGIANPVMDLMDAAARLLANSRPVRPPVRPVIVISDAIAASAKSELAREGDIVEVDGTDVPRLRAAVAEAEGLVVRSETQVDEALIQAAGRLRVIARAGVGVDNIDVPAATRAGVLVLNAPGSNSVSAGEHTIAIMLALSRQLAEANASMHASRWERKRFVPFDLKGKTVGIVGLGRVGTVVAQRLTAFEIEVIACDPYVPAERFVELGVEAVSYQGLLSRSDVVTFHCPLTDETHNMLDRETVRLLKPGAIVINCARGGVVDDDALFEALQGGHLRGAGVDVFPHEPVEHSVLAGLPNVILTPHIGGSSVEAQAAVGEIISRSMLAALRGESVPNAVNLPTASIDAGDLRRLTHMAGAAGHLLSVLEPKTPHTFSMTVHGRTSLEIMEFVLTSALSDALGHWTADRVTPVNARIVAEAHGLDLRVNTIDSGPANVIEFAFEVQNAVSHHVTVRWDTGEVGIVEVDRFSLGQPLAGDVLITHHNDRPGIIGHIGMILGRHSVNIAGMQVGRHQRGGEAIMVLNVDDAIPQEALADVLALEDIHTAYVVSLPDPQTPRAEPASLPQSV
jgi:D-3-phosphoglycerate dehydrogenase / 2-oxoglutarate reductase